MASPQQLRDSFEDAVSSFDALVLSSAIPCDVPGKMVGSWVAIPICILMIRLVGSKEMIDPFLIHHSACNWVIV